MFKNIKYISTVAACCSLAFAACNMPTASRKIENRTTPASYNSSQDSTNTARLKWHEFFKDPYLKDLIDTALKNNQELNITLQEIAISRSEVKVRKGEYLPFVGLRGAAGLDKAARYTNIGAMEATTEIEPGKEMPEPVPDYVLGAYASWEVDVWKKLRNAKKSAVNKYLASVEGRNFVVTSLIAEVANSYYELVALDNQLRILQQNIEIQSNAFEVVKLQKTAARVTELAVKRFEGQLLKTKSLEYNIKQQITETENRINFLLGRFPQPIARNANGFDETLPGDISSGIPSQLLSNRPDVRKAEIEMAAAKLDVKIAKADFYPSVRITASAGLQAFNPSYLVKAPESILYSLAGDLVAPLINRNAIKANYYAANARQVQAIYNYERAILNAHIEVVNQLARIGNLEKSRGLRTDEVEVLKRSVEISNDLFKSARADYMEVLMTQRDALESRFELIEIRKQRMNALVNIYQALGGGWN